MTDADLTPHGTSVRALSEQAPSKKRPLWPLLVTGLGLVALVGLGIGWKVHSGDKSQPAAQASAKRDVPYLDGNLIRFSPEFGQRVGIKTQPAALNTITPLINVTGTLSFDPKRVAAIGARISGRVFAVHKVEGDWVKKGEPLAEIESAELGRAQAAALTARARAAAATAREKRQRQLAEAHISSVEDAETAHAEAEAARAELSAADQAVKALGGTVGSAPGILVLSSPIEGKIIDSHLSKGQFVEPSYTGFRVADLSRLWVELAVFERELSAIHIGNPVQIRPQGSPEKALEGQVAYVGDVIDEQTRSAVVRVEVDNKDGVLRAGQSVKAHIHTNGASAQVIILPRAAVTMVDGKPTVFAVHDQATVEPKTVQLGASDAQQVEILSGLEPGQQVVTEGVFALKSEIFR